MLVSQAPERGSHHAVDWRHSRATVWCFSSHSGVQQTYWSGSFIIHRSERERERKMWSKERRTIKYAKTDYRLKKTIKGRSARVQWNERMFCVAQLSFIFLSARPGLLFFFLTLLSCWGLWVARCFIFCLSNHSSVITLCPLHLVFAGAYTHVCACVHQSRTILSSLHHCEFYSPFIQNLCSNIQWW